MLAPPPTAPTLVPPAGPGDGGAPDGQAEAIAHGEGPALVLAAPGSGKTYVVTRRFIRLVGEGLDPHDVLVLTHSRRAADELQRRVEGELGPIDGDPPLTTYHAWAQALVRRFGWHLGWPATLRVATDAERWVHLAAVLAEVRPRALHNPARPYEAVREVKNHIERCKQELVEPDAYLRLAEERLEAAGSEQERSQWQLYRDLAHVYRSLQSRYRAEGLIDHDDSIAVAAQLLADVPAVREACAGVRHVMVDEFQDTNSAQAMLVERLVAPHRNLMVVADDDQSIYRFRGAARFNIQRFGERFPEARTIHLVINRRSTPQIVAMAQTVIERAASRETKVARPDRPDGEPVRVIAAENSRDEAAAAVAEVRERLAGGCRPGDIAVLSQLRADLEPVAQALRDAEIPYRTAGGRDFFRAPEVKGILALLEAVADPDAALALQGCLHLPAFRASPAGRLEISRATRDSGASLVELLRHGGVPGLSEEDRESARRLADAVLDLHALAARDDVRDLFMEAMLRSEYARLGDLDRLIERRQFAANVSRFYEILDEYCTVRPGARLEDALEYLHLMRDAGGEGIAPIDDETEGVVLSTIHSAKGLEWPHVVVVAAAQGRMPKRSQTEVFPLPEGLAVEVHDDPGGHREEQRRLFYVALTRARDTLAVTWARRYPSFHTECERSEFLAETGGPHLVERSQPFTPPPVPRRRMLPELRIGGRLELSHSTIEAYRRCPKQFEYRVLWRMTPTFSPDAWYGDLLHCTLRRAGELRLAGREVDPELVGELWEAEWQRAGGPKGRLRHLRPEGAARLRDYVASPLWRDADARLVEHPFTLRLDERQQWHLVGRLDRLDMGPDGVPEVIDYKTGRPGSESPDRSAQLKVYGMVAAGQFGVDEVRCSIHWLQTGTSATVVRSRKDLDRFRWGIAQTFTEIARAHEEGRFPARPSGYSCPRCPYRVICPEKAEP